MDIDEIIQKGNELGIDQTRAVENKYAEIVILSRLLEDWSRLLESFFGPPVKPSGMTPATLHHTITMAYGGIEKNQVLYAKNFDNKTMIAMIWPWQDQKHITLKMADAG